MVNTIKPFKSNPTYVSGRWGDASWHPPWIRHCVQRPFLCRIYRKNSVMRHERGRRFQFDAGAAFSSFILFLSRHSLALLKISWKDSKSKKIAHFPELVCLFVHCLAAHMHFVPSIPTDEHWYCIQDKVITIMTKQYMEMEDTRLRLTRFEFLEDNKFTALLFTHQN